MDDHTTDLTPEQVLAEVATEAAEELDTDFILYNGAITRNGADEFILQLMVRCLRANVVLILVTRGGNADSAYRIARHLQNCYGRFTLFVSGYCKSAGTLIATGAHELVMSEYGELGPLDVQMSKRDELWESQSGLAVEDTLIALQHRAQETFVGFLLNLKEGSGGSVSLKMATEVATSMTSGLFAPIYGQIDPLHVGEAGRAMNITSEYGQRLLEVGKNIEQAKLLQIISGYPSHEFVIDLKEANQLFKSVRQPDERESLLAALLGARALLPSNSNDLEPPTIHFLSPEPAGSDAEDQGTSTNGGHHEQSADSSKRALTGVAQDADPKSAEDGRSEGEAVEELPIPHDYETSGVGQEIPGERPVGTDLND